MARNNEGLNWNYAIAPAIDRDLHGKLLAIDSKEVLPFIQLLPLIASGYFGTSLDILATIELTDAKLLEIKEWLVGALNEAREV